VKFPVLVSYACARKNLDEFALIANNPHVELLLDSGAFTAKNTGEDIRLRDYCEFLDAWKGKLFRYLALDVVGNPKATDANLREMLRSGYKPVPVHVLGDDQRRMDELFEMSDYVALAGLRRPKKGPPPKEYVAAKMRWAAGRDVHWLGYVREPMIAAFRPYSCDSATWLNATLYGLMSVYYGRGVWRTYTRKTVQHFVRDNRAAGVMRQVGFGVRQLLDDLAWKAAGDCISFSVAVDSWVRYVIDIAERFRSKIFLACSPNVRDVTQLLRAINTHSRRLDLTELTA
jgi:hypothetical protein